MSNKLLKSILCASTVLGAGLAVPTLASAQDTGVVVVTARRVQERLQDVPISMTVFSQQKLSNSNIVNAEDLARITPSLSVNNNFGSDNASYAIRGFVQETGTAPSVGVFFADVVAPRALTNGVPAGDGANAGSFFDLQSVQVLKGPQGTLFGLNTTGGDVLLVPQKPTNHFGGYVEGSYGNYDMRRIQAVVNLPVNDWMRLRLGVDHQVRDGYLNNTSGIGPNSFGNVNYTAFRGSMVLDITPNLQNYTVVSWADSNNNGDVQKMIAAPGGSFSPLALAQAARQGSGYYDVQQTETSPESRVQTWQVINTTTWKPSGDLTIKNIASYAELRDDLVSSLFGVDLQLAIPQLGSFPVGFAEVHHLPGGDTAHQSTITDELQVQGKSFDDRLTWQIGGYMEASLPIGVVGAQSAVLASCIDSSTFQCTDILGLVSGGVPTGAINLSESQTYYHDLAIYGQTTYKVLDNLKLTAGYRYTWDHEEDHSIQKTFSLYFPPRYGASATSCTQPLTAPQGCANNLYQESSKPTWMLGLDYNPVHDVLLYAKYSRGYRTGTIAPDVTAPLNIVQPETVDTYELGFKSTFAQPVRGMFNAAVFYNDFTNQQIEVGFYPKPGVNLAPTGAPINAGASEIYGSELGASISPFRGLTMDVNYTYLFTRINRVADLSGFNDPNFFLAASFHVGDPLVLTPKNKVVFDVNYTLPLADSIGKISVGATYSHTDRMVSDYNDRTVPAFVSLGWIPATDLLDLNASWTDILGRPVDASLFATNVTGQNYYTFTSGLDSVSTVNGHVINNNLGLETVQLGQPTMYGIRLKYHFGG